MKTNPMLSTKPTLKTSWLKVREGKIDVPCKQEIQKGDSGCFNVL